MNKNVEKKLSSKEVKSIVTNVELSKSSKMRQLFDDGYDIKEISIMLEVRYNFVFNIIDKYILQLQSKDVNIEVIKNTKRSNVKEDIINMLQQNIKVREISQVLNVSDNYIYKLRKELNL